MFVSRRGGKKFKFWLKLFKASDATMFDSRRENEIQISDWKLLRISNSDWKFFKASDATMFVSRKRLGLCQARGGKHGLIQNWRLCKILYHSFIWVSILLLDSFLFRSLIGNKCFKTYFVSLSSRLKLYYLWKYIQVRQKDFV